MATAYSYIRCSTPEQLKGDTLRRQLADTKAWAERHGHVLDDTLRDLGRSAFKGAHRQFGALGKFLELVRQGEVPAGSILVVESLDRLSREDVLDALPRLLDLIAAGVKIVTLADGQEYSDKGLRANPMPLVFSLLIMMRANEESRTKSMRVGKAWLHKRVRAAETGQAMTSICPAWIRLVGGPRDGRYELIVERAAIVRRIFEDTIAGQGRRAIAKALNGERVPTWGVGGKKGLHWHDSYIQKILENPAAYGRFEPLSKRAGGDGRGNIVLDGYFPAAIDEALFYAARAASQARGYRQGRTSVGNRNLLRGLAKCHCGGNLTIVDKGARSSGPKLICSSANIGGECKDRTFYPYRPLELGVLAAVSDRLDQLVLSSRDRAGEIRLQRDAAAARRADLQARLDNLVELVASGGGGATVATKVAGLQKEIDAATFDAVKLEAEVRSAELADQDGASTGFIELVRQLRDTAGDEQSRVRAAIHLRLSGLVERIDVTSGEAVVKLAGGGEAYVAGF